MSDKSHYYESGKERGRAGKSTPLGFFSLANKEEERAAQRGWEAGQSAREHAEAIKEALEAAKADDEVTDYHNTDYDSTGSSTYISSSSPSTQKGDASEGFGFIFVLGLRVLMALFWGLVAWGVGGLILYAAGSAFGPVNSGAVFSFSQILGLIGFAVSLWGHFKEVRGEWEQGCRDVGALFRSIAIAILVIIGLCIGFVILGAIVNGVFSAR